MTRLKPVMTSLAERILDSFPSGNYAISALLQLLEIVESIETETAAVECRVEPRLLINPTFVDSWAFAPEKLLMLVMHELHHVLLGHTRLFPRVTKVDNLVFDAVINALLCRMFPQPEHTSFFTDYYDESAFPECLLRPAPKWTPESGRHLPSALLPKNRSRIASIYIALYSSQGAGYKELFDVLRGALNETMAEDVKLIGDHTTKANSTSADGQLESTSPFLVEAVRSIVERWPVPPNPTPGRSLGDILKSAEVRPIRHLSNRAALRGLFRKVGGQFAGSGSNRSWIDSSIEIMSPVPAIERRGIVMQALGLNPILHRHTLSLPRHLPAGERVHVYLDVSGSIGDLKGALYGAVLDCQQFVHPVIHLFSTKIADVSFEGLRRGECNTTFGTDIACVADHMAEHRVKRAVVLTDGFVGRPSVSHHQTLKKACLGVALIKGGSIRSDLNDVTDHWIDLN